MMDAVARTDAPSLVASAADAIYLVDELGRVQYANPAALAILGYVAAESELLGRPSHATIHHSHPDGTPFPEDQCPLLEPRRTGAAVRQDDDWFIRRDGTFVPVAYSSAPVQMADGRGAVVVFHDTTERIAIERAQRDAAVERTRAEELHASRARIVAATHDERRRLGRDLHDGAQQHLVNVSIALQRAAAEVSEPGLAELIAQALSETRSAIEDLRELAAGLVPSVLLHRGLRGAIESLTARAPLPVELDVTDVRLDPLVEAAAYFFVSEALTNVAKHAQAQTAAVRAHVDAGWLEVEVEDDGVGGADAMRGSGLRGLDDRVQALDGTLKIESSPGGGTLLRARLPISPPAAT
jgi:PAS domain S-box-containing protein